MLYLGIDSGTQSTKAVVLDVETGQTIASAVAAYGFIPGLPEGHLEQHPNDWVKATDETISAVLERVGARRSEVRGIGVSAQQHGLVALDREGKVVRPAKLWCDTSTAAQCDAFAEEFGGQKNIVRLFGNPILPGYTAPKILWLKQKEPHHYKKAATILLPHDYLNYWLTGVKSMEYGDASGTGLLDVRTRKWSDRLIDFIDLDLKEKLPPVQSSKRAAGLLRDELRTKWDLPKTVIVSSGGGDNMMGAIGTGNIRPGVVTASFGTSGTLFACAAQPVIDEREYEVAAFCDSADQWLPLVCTMNVTIATEQMRELFGWDHTKLNAAVAAARPGSDGLLFLPYLNGERTPNLPNGTGVLHGLTTRNYTPENIARATMEGVTLGLAFGLERLAELKVVANEIRMIGGGSKSAVWRQIAADIFGVPVVCPVNPEGAALGAAIQAAWVEGLTTGRGGTLEKLCADNAKFDESTRCTPNPDVVAMYADLLNRQTGLTGSLHDAGYL